MGLLPRGGVKKHFIGLPLVQVCRQHMLLLSCEAAAHWGACRAGRGARSPTGLTGLPLHSTVLPRDGRAPVRAGELPAEGFACKSGR